MDGINSALAKEIREKHSYFIGKERSFTSLALQKIRHSEIKKNARISSFRIEHPELSVPHSVPRNTRKKLIREGVRNLESAFRWGSENFDPSYFDDGILKGINGRIFPNVYGGEFAAYRTMGTSVRGAMVTPPYPEKLLKKEIPSFVDEMNFRLQSYDLMDRICTAIFAHLHVARIHPFYDGNGRTARTLQNVVLSSAKIPSPIIEPGERHHYYSMLDKAVVGWKHEREQGTLRGVSNGERLFNEFIAGKINVSLDKILYKK